MLHAAFQKHAGEFETPAVSFQDLFEDPWAPYSLFSSRAAEASVLLADSKGTVSTSQSHPRVPGVDLFLTCGNLVIPVLP